jgi:hypothetical protein
MQETTLCGKFCADMGRSYDKENKMHLSTSNKPVKQNAMAGFLSYISS